MARTSERLREQLEDLYELYDSAKMNENAPLMEKLTKSISALAKQVKEHEIHERETMKRDTIRRMSQTLGVSVGRAIRRYVKDEDLANLIVEAIVEDIDEIVEDKETF